MGFCYCYVLMLWASFMVVQERFCDTNLGRFIREINQTAENYTVFTKGGNYTEFGDGMDVINGSKSGNNSEDFLGVNRVHNFTNLDDNDTKANRESGLRTHLGVLPTATLQNPDNVHNSLHHEGLTSTLDYNDNQSSKNVKSLFGLNGEGYTEGYVKSGFRSSSVGHSLGNGETTQEVVTESDEFVSSGNFFSSGVLLSKRGHSLSGGDLLTSGGDLLSKSCDLVSRTGDLVTTSDNLVTTSSNGYVTNNDDLSIGENVQSSGLYVKENTHDISSSHYKTEFTTNGGVKKSKDKSLTESAVDIRPTATYAKPRKKSFPEKPLDAHSDIANQGEPPLKGSFRHSHTSISEKGLQAETSSTPDTHTTTKITTKKINLNPKSRHKLRKNDTIRLKNVQMQNDYRNIKRSSLKNEKGSDFVNSDNFTAKDLTRRRNGLKPFRTFLRTGNKDVGGPAEYNPNSKTRIYIGGLFELSQTSYEVNGHSELETAKMAIDDVNEQGILKGYELKMKHHDTKCDPGVGTDALYDFIYNKPQILMVIGSACSSVTQTVGQLISEWNLLQISFAATSPALSNTLYYKDFYRLVAADSSHNTARRLFIQHFGWDTVATITEDAEIYTLAISDMTKVFESANISVMASATFRSNEKKDLRLKMEDLQEEDARIIIGSFGEPAARQVFCEAYRLGLYGPRYVWMILGQYTDKWWTVGNSTNCTEEQLSEAVAGLFTVDALNALLGDQPSTSGLKTDEFIEKYESLGLPSPRSPYAPQTYDTIWTAALVMKEALKRGARLNEFTYRHGKSMKNLFKSIMENLEFFGVSGPVSFEGPDRRGVTVLEQNQGGKMVRLALCYPDHDTLDFHCPGCQPVVWQSRGKHGGKVPCDKTKIQSYMKVIQVTAFHVITGISCFGIVKAMAFLAFNLLYRKLKYIKLSSPRLNNVAVIGCIWVYMAVILLGLDERNLEAHFFPVACTVRAFLFAAGFSFAFGAMFTKTYRVHHICSRANSGLVKSKLLKDKQLLFIVGALLIVDVFIISLWGLIDPMHRQVLNFTEEISEEDPDVMFVPQLSRCHSIHIEKWTGALYAYKGLLLIFGVYMAWSTRHVKIPALNDSQYIGFSVYNVVIMSVIVVVLSNILTNEPTMSYLIISSCILVSTAATLCLLFLPKIYTIMKMGGNQVITTSGLTVEANTRRFIVDDRKEIYYRAEVQNRIFKRELNELDSEICRLERMLDMPASPRYHKKEDHVFIYPIDKKAGKSPKIGRRKKSEMKQLEPITDEEDISDLPDVCAGHFADRKRQMDKEDSGIYTMSFKSNRSCMLQPIESTCSIDEETELTEIEGLKEELLNDYRLKNFSSELHSRYAVKDNHAVRSSNRRQKKYDGLQHERESLLRHCEQSPTEETCALVHTRTSPTESLGENEFEMTELKSSGADAYALRESMQNVGSSQDRRKGSGRSRAFSCTPSVEVTPPPEEGARKPSFGFDAQGLRKSRSEQEKIQAEFSKIKRQLKSLGDLKVEVAHV